MYCWSVAAIASCAAKLSTSCAWVTSIGISILLSRSAEYRRFHADQRSHRSAGHVLAN
jgi:hypothetical protein